MMDRWERAKAIFHAASEVSPADRAAFLEAACGDDAELRAEVATLLDAQRDAGSFLDVETVTTPASSPSEGPGTRVGRYKLLQKIGEGGFGSVYMAEQEEPVRRKVALKIIKLGMDTKQVIARFEAERQALALMDHPNIARVLDAGATSTGRPFFVMELVRGVPITKYCDENNLSTRDRLELFLGVCGAVQHAHQKGIIHRDIKPSNVMITLHDGTPVPKVIDFGIAKATSHRLTEKTLFTQYHQFIGTPEYMSPEQAEMSGLDVDTRTDIYSLGVLLYELLTGTTPVDPVKLRSIAYSEIHQLIRDTDPQRPSTRVSTLGDAATDTARHRSTDARTLRRSLSGDLDWIVMKALEKDRTRRYETANGFMLDIRRHLDDEPVLASPPTPAYRFRKFVSRNRTAVSVAVVVAVALLAGLGLATYGFIQADRERAIARQEAESAEQINTFFAEMLASVDPFQIRLRSSLSPTGSVPDAASASDDISVQQMLLNGLERIDDAFPGKPLLEAEARETIGTTLLGLGANRVAIEQLEAALALRREVQPAMSRDVLRARLLVGVGAAVARVPALAERISQPLLEDMQRELGPDDPMTLGTAALYAAAVGNQGRASQGDSLFADVLERQRRVLGSDHRDTIQSLISWSGLWCWRGNGFEAAKLSSEAYERSLATYGADDAQTIAAGTQYALSLTFQGKDEEAEALSRPLLAKVVETYGDDHPMAQNLRFALIRALDWTTDADEVEALFRAETLGSINWVARRDFGNFFLLNGRVDDALEVFAEQYEYWSPLDHSEEIDQARLSQVQTQAYRNYHRCLKRAGRAEDADRLTASWIRRLRLHADAPDADPAHLEACAWLLVTAEPEDLRDPPAALRYATRAVKAARESADHSSVAGHLDTKAKALELTGRVGDAFDAELEALELWFALSDGAKRSEVRNLRYWTIQAIRYASELREDEKAHELIDRTVAEMERLLSPAAASRAINELAGELRERGLFDVAERARRRALALARQAGDEPQLLDVLDRLASLCAEAGALEEAHALLDEASALYADLYVSDAVDWRPDMGFAEEGERSRAGVLAKRKHANALAHAGRLDEAEELVRQIRCSRPDASHGTMARILWRRGDPTAAEEEYRRQHDADVRAGGHREWPALLARSEAYYGRCLARNGKYEEAEKHLLAGYARALEWGGPRSFYVGEISQALEDLYERWGKPALAAEWRDDRERTD